MLAVDTLFAAVLSEWAPLLETGRADLVFCGHQHVYSRSYPMRAGAIDYENGITYVMGNAGQKFYTTADTSYSEKTIFSKSTYQIININGDTLSLSSYDSDGNLLDTWSATAKSRVLSGDVNGDGMVNILDVVQAVNFAMGETTLTTEQFNTADTNADGSINILDVVQIVNKALGS